MKPNGPKAEIRLNALPDAVLPAEDGVSFFSIPFPNTHLTSNRKRVTENWTTLRGPRKRWWKLAL
jgi:hypothetical protein